MSEGERTPLEKRTMHIDVEDDKAWIFDIRSCGKLPDAPLHLVLRWVLQQLNFGMFQLEKDEAGDAVTLVLGKEAAPSFPEPVVDTAAQFGQNRARALLSAGLFATAREVGIPPEYAAEAEQARATATENGYMNTEFHYAFQLIGLLERIREHTFVFSSPPINATVPDEVSRLLKETTRAYLFHLNRSCVALCRALLEAVLRDRIDRTELYQEISSTKKGELECLINLSWQKGLLTAETAGRAHRIRQAGNKAVHGPESSDDEAWNVLLDTRLIVEHLCA